DLYEMPGVQCFCPGEWNGEPWGESDIDRVIANFATYRDQLVPTVGLGHTDATELTAGLPSTATDDDGQPAFGVVANVGKQPGAGGPFLTADLRNIPAWLAARIAGKSYITCSIELYNQGARGSGLADA